MRVYLNLESYSPVTSAGVNHQDEVLNADNDDEDGDTYKMLLRLLRFFQMLDRDKRDNIYNQH